MKTFYMHSYKLFGVVSIILLLFIFSFSAEAAQASTLTALEQQQLAALSLQLNALSKLIEILKSSLFSSVSAQTASTTPDTTPPSTPTSLAAFSSVVSSSQINLAWYASTDNVGVTGYKIYRGGTQIATVTMGTSYSDTGLSASTAYSYAVAAYDAAGNVSSQSSTAILTTQSSSTSPPPSPPPSSTSDTTPPTAPTLSGYAVSGTQVSLSWSGATDNVGVTGYKIFRNNTLLTNVTTISYQDNAVAANTSYSYYVKAYDAAGNESLPSNTVTVTTPSANTSPPPSSSNSYGSTLNLSGVTDVFGKIWGQGSNGIIIGGGLNFTTQPGFGWSQQYGGIYVTSYSILGTQSNYLTQTSSVSVTVTGPTGFIIEVWDLENLTVIATNKTSLGSSITFTAQPNHRYGGFAWYADNSQKNIEIHAVYSSSISADTVPPTVPTLSASANSSSVSLSWSGATDNIGVMGYKIWRNSIYLTSVTTLSYVDNAVSVSTTYNYYVQAYDAAGNYSPNSNSVNVTTPATSGVTSTASSAPAVPSNFTYTFSNNNATVNLRWQDNSNDETGFTIYRQSSSGSWVTLGTVGPNVSFFSDTPPAGTYYYQVSACNTTLCSPGINIGSITVGSGSGSTSTTTISVGPNITPPTAPTGLIATAISPSQIRLSWSAATDNVGVTSYQVFRNNLSWSKIGTTTTYMDTLVTSNTSYSYYIKAFDAAGNESLPSNTVTVSTPASGLMIPYGFFSRFLPQQVNTGSVYADNVLYIGGFGATAPVIGFKVFRDNAFIGTISGTTFGYYDTTVSPMTTYTYYAKSFDAAGNESVASETITATTPFFSGRTITTSIISTTTAISTLPPPPPPSQTIMFAVDPIQTMPFTGAIGVDSGTRIKVKFTKEFDPASTIGQFFSLTPAANPSTYVNGTFFMAGDSFEFAPSSALLPNASYVYTVFTILRDKSGAPLANPFSATFTTAAGTSISGGIVEGLVTDPDGRPVANTSIRIYKEDFSANFGTVTAQDGLFSLGIPAGTYFIELYPPPYLPVALKDLVRPAPMRFSIASGERKKLSFQFTVPAKVISGAVTFSNGASVPDAEVGAYSSETNQWTSALVDISGKFTLRVGGGKWKVGIRPREPVGAKWSWFGPFPDVEFAKDAISETKTANFVVPLADVKLVVRTVDDKGALLSDAGIILDTLSAARTDEISKSPPEFRRSDAKGEVNFTLRAGNYYLRAYLSPVRGYLNPEEQALTVASGESREIKLVFRKRELEKFLSIKGIIKFEDGAPTDAFVWAWSEKGRFFDTHSNTNGEFTIPVSAKDHWHIGAGKLIGTIRHKSSEVVIEVGADSVSMEIVLVKIREELPPAVSASQSATQQVVVQAQDGAKMAIPPSVAAPSGTVNVDIKPTVEAPSQAGAAVVSTVYDVTVHDAAGKEVTTLTEEAEITIPYDKKELKAKGVSEDAIVPSFLDEKTGSWVKLDNYTIDKDKSVVIARVKHLTRFAIVAAADITSPNPPSAASATALGGGKIKISWINPTKDFDHAKVYRSQKAGELGEIRAAEVAGTEFTDMDLTDGIIYYYTVRAVDPAGNESGNNEQVSVKAVGTSAKAKPQVVENKKKSIPPGQKVKLEILRNLTVGSKGEDVKEFQQLLLNAGVYTNGLITGFFGNLTKQAVIRFQEKYSDEILTPVGLTKGNGFVGARTRKKINQFRLLPTEVK